MQKPLKEENVQEMEDNPELPKMQAEDVDIKNESDVIKEDNKEEDLIDPDKPSFHEEENISPQQQDENQDKKEMMTPSEEPPKDDDNEKDPNIVSTVITPGEISE